MATKKFAIYSGIIALMLIGMGYMLYLNSRLANISSLTVDQANQFNNALPGGETLATPTKPEIKIDGQPSQTRETIGSGGLDLKIFNNEKFKSLIDNSQIPKTQPSLGKRDPFRPN